MNDFQKSQSTKILSCYFEKSKANIGEIRNWGRINYKKIDEGKWVKIQEIKSGKKEKELTSSTVKKVIDTELKQEFEKFKSIQKEFEENWKKINNIGDIQNNIVYKVKLSRAKETDPIYREHYNNYEKIRKDLTSELHEIIDRQKLLEKRKREEEVGKKEISTQDDYFKGNFESFNSIFKKIESVQTRATPQEALGNPSVDDYYLFTDAHFKPVLEFDPNKAVNKDGVFTDYVLNKFEEMKNSGKYEYTHSPKSSSQYLVDRKTGDVYRIADHWGKCASYFWSVDFEKSRYGLAVCNIKDFKRNEQGTCLNPQKVSAVQGGAKTILSELNKMITNEKVYFDETAIQKIKNMTNKVGTILRYSNKEGEEEFERIKKEYDKLFSL